MDNDVDLLFGALAVHAGYITPTQLAAAREVCKHLPGESLPRLLTERNWITPKKKAELDLLVRDKLDQHKGSVREALSAVTDAETGRAIGFVQVRELDGTVAYTPPEESCVRVETVDWKPDSRSRYTLTRVQGRGGLGQVWLAIDEHLHREVALKEILPTKQDRPTTATQLMKEAQITGQLEHPNIVPVYEMARGPDERPFYTMRFLRGRALMDRIREYHHARRDGKHDPLELRELLTIFVSICNAMAYAHARGVIHRDLKPQNVMLGDFGEVMVVDWGLAKLVSQPDDEGDYRKIEVADERELTATLEGKLMGTPAYMSPEQADGHISLLDARTDIYGLGGILFAILSGHAPHISAQPGQTAKDTMHLVRQISEGPTPHVRPLDPMVPKALDAICAKAMAKKKSDRYRTASELAKDVTCWLADEPVSVYTATWSERVVRWLRRHRVWAQAGAVVLIFVTIAASISAVVVSRARDRVSNALRSEQLAHQETERSLASERSALEAERQAKAEATRRFKQARDTIDKSLTGVSDALQNFPGVEPARRGLLEQAANDYEQFANDDSDDPELRLEAGRARVRLGDVRRLLVQHEQAEQAYRSAEQLFRNLSDATPDNAEYQLELALTHGRLGVLFTTTGPHGTAERYFQLADENLDALIAKNADAPRYRYEQAGAWINHALLLAKTNDFVAARKHLEQAEQELQRLAETSSIEEIEARLAKARAELGQQLLMMGQASEAADKLRDAIATFRTVTTLAPDHPPYFEALAATRVYLANTERSLGRDAAVVDAYKESIHDYENLLIIRPGVPDYRASLAAVRIDLAQMLHMLNRNPDAMEAAKQALSELIDLVDSFSAVHRYREYHAICTQTFGIICRDLNDDENAELALRDAVRRFEELSVAVPDVPEYRRRLAGSLSSLGRLLHKRGKGTEAEQAFAAAVDQFQKTTQAGLNDAYTKDALAWCHTHLGDLLRQSGESDKARVNYLKALVLRESLPTQAEHTYALASFLVTCDDTELRDPARAIALAQQARQLAPNNPRYAHVLGLAHYRAGKWDDSITALKQADSLRIYPSAFDSFVLAMAHHKRGDKGESVASYDRAARLMQEHSPGNGDLIKLRTEAARVLEIPESR
jgi:serine/threonine-protein kinase